jgi:putative transcriptional regulator
VSIDPPPDWVLQVRRRVGHNVRDVRSDMGWSQETLGEVTGLDRKTISRIENAQFATSIDHMALIARGLRVSLHRLVREYPAIGVESGQDH